MQIIWRVRGVGSIYPGELRPTEPPDCWEDELEEPEDPDEDSDAEELDKFGAVLGGRGKHA